MRLNNCETFAFFTKKHDTLSYQTEFHKCIFTFLVAYLNFTYSHLIWMIFTSLVHQIFFIFLSLVICKEINYLIYSTSVYHQTLVYLGCAFNIYFFSNKLKYIQDSESKPLTDRMAESKWISNRWQKDVKRIAKQIFLL